MGTRLRRAPRLRRPGGGAEGVAARFLFGSAFVLWPVLATIAVWTRSWSTTTALGIPLVAAVWLAMIGIPPWPAARHVVTVWLVVTGPISIWMWSAWRAATVSIAATLAGIVLSIALLCWLAQRNFRQLQELSSPGPALFEDDAMEISVAHVSDLHITDGAGTARFEGGPGGLGQWRDAIAFARERRASFIVVSGDMTDGGRDREWAQFHDAWRAAPLPRPRLVLCPGNHDLAGDDYGGSSHHSEYYDWSHPLDRYFAVAAEETPEFVTALDVPVADIAGLAQTWIAPRVAEAERALRARYLMWDSLKPVPPERFIRPEWERWSSDYRKNIEAYDWKALAREKLAYDWFEEQWYALFPLVGHAASDHTLFVVLNSVGRSLTAGGSALGAMGAEQRARLDSCLAVLPTGTKNVVIVTHHPLFRRPGQWRMALNHDAYRQLQDFALLTHLPEETRLLATSLAAAADRHRDVNFVLLYGHRHGPAVGRFGLLLVVEAGALSEASVNFWGLAQTASSIRLARKQII